MDDDYMLSAAEQQIIGFSAAIEHGNISRLADAMGLTAREWAELRDDVAVFMREEDLMELDRYFK